MNRELLPQRESPQSIQDKKWPGWLDMPPGTTIEVYEDGVRVARARLNPKTGRYETIAEC